MVLNHVGYSLAIRVTALMLILCGHSIADQTATAKTGTISVIVNKDNDVGKLSKIDIKRIFLKKRKAWPKGKLEGSIINVVSQPYSREITGFFSNTVLEMSLNDQKKYWTEQRYKGGELHPEIRHNTQDVIEFIEENKSSVGYVITSENLLKNSNVKVIAEFKVTSSQNEAQVKLIIEALKFIPGLKREISVLVIGDDAISDTFLCFLGEKQNEITIAKVSSPTTLPKVKPDLLFIGKNSNISSLLHFAAKNNVATVTNSYKIFQHGTNLVVWERDKRISISHKDMNGVKWLKGIESLKDN